MNEFFKKNFSFFLKQKKHSKKLCFVVSGLQQRQGSEVLIPIEKPWSARNDRPSQSCVCSEFDVFEIPLQKCLTFLL